MVRTKHDMVKTRRTTTRSWAEGCEAVRSASRHPSLLDRLRRLWDRRQATQTAFSIGNRVRITKADPEFIDRIGTEAIVASELERGDDGRMYYRLDNNMSAQPECLTLLEQVAEPDDRTRQ